MPKKRRWLLPPHAELADGVLRRALVPNERWYREATGREGGTTWALDANPGDSEDVIRYLVENV